MNNTAQDNGINLSYPQFDDGSTPQPNSQPQQQNTQPSDNNIVGSNYGDFSGKVNTLPAGLNKLEWWSGGVEY